MPNILQSQAGGRFEFVGGAGIKHIIYLKSWHKYNYRFERVRWENEDENNKIEQKLMSTLAQDRSEKKKQKEKKKEKKQEYKP